MANSQNLPIELTVMLRSDNPDLLQGLDQWLKLGLISETQVLRIARSLTCVLPTVPVTRKVATLPDAAEVLAARGRSDRPRDFSDSPEPQRPPTPVLASVEARFSQTEAPPTSQNSPTHSAQMPQVLTALMAELSVLWLLLLGLFLVVVSSAVLAATQWENFSPVGQYLILFTYTLAFGFAGLWCSAKPKLQLTGRMLQVTTLLIIPVNFWTIDGFQLWHYPTGWLVAVIAAVALTVLNLRLIRGSDRLTKFNSLALPWLQWGWGIPGIALLLTYLGTVGTTGMQAWKAQRETPDYRSPGSIAILFASLLLMARAVLAQGIGLNHLGLALALMGGLLVWLDRRIDKPLWQYMGWAAIGLGWVASVMPSPDLIARNIDPLWQTLGISGIALVLLIDRLKRYGETGVLLALWFVGLQSYAVLRVIFPQNIRQSIMAYITELANLQAGAWEMTGLGFLGYGVITLLGSVYLRRRQMASLALLNEQLTLGLGIVLMVPGLFNPLVRAIYFTLFSLGLGTVLATRRSRFADWSDSVVTSLGLLVQGTGVLAALSWGYWLFPRWSMVQWGWVFLIGAMCEWGVTLLSRDRFWQKASWYLGMALATCAYPLLAVIIANSALGLPWLVVPMALTGLGYRAPNKTQATTNFGLATIAIIISCFHAVDSTVAWITMSVVGTIVMGLVSWRWTNWPIALLTLLYGVSAVTTGYDQIFHPTNSRAFLFLSVGFALGLWVIRQVSDRFNPELARAYRLASDGLATAFTLLVIGWIGLDLGLLSLVFSSVGSAPTRTLLETLGVTGGISAAIAYRQWQKPSNLGWLGLVACSMLLVNGLASLGHWSWDGRTIAILALGTLSLLLGNWWDRSRSLPRIFDAIPLLYGALALVFAHGTMAAHTGVYSIATAGLALGIGRREVGLKPLSYLGLLGISAGAYELLGYQLWHSPNGGLWGDGIVLLSALGTGMGLTYRALGRWIAPALRLETEELATVAQLHWAAGAMLAFGALLTPLSPLGELLWIGLASLLGAEAIARSRQNPQGDLWVYTGVFAIVLALGRFLLRTLPDGFVFGWGGLIAGGVALGIDRLPWTTWGWELRPWRRVSQVGPGLVTLLMGTGNYIPSLILTGGVYALLSLSQGQVWLSYLGLGLADWGGVRWLWQQGVMEPLFYVAMFSGSLIYVTHVEARLQDQRETRHGLRMLAMGLFCVTAFYEVGMASWGRGLLTVGLGLAVTLFGIALRTRAYLYVGTMMFMLAVLRQLWLFISSESLLLWVLGIGLGLLLIWIAATFEARRSQTIALLQSWANELDRWA